MNLSIFPSRIVDDCSFMPIRFVAFCSNELMVVVILWCEKPYLDASAYHLDSVRCIWKISFLTNFSWMFVNPNIFSNLNYNCSNLWDIRNLQEQVKKVFCNQKLFWPFTAWIKGSDFKKFANSRLSFFSITRHFFFSLFRNNFINKVPFTFSFKLFRKCAN